MGCNAKTTVSPNSLYSEVWPTKFLPIVELKYKGRVINKLYSGLQTSAMRVVGRIDKQMQTAMLAYPAILIGNGVHYAQVGRAALSRRRTEGLLLEVHGVYAVLW